MAAIRSVCFSAFLRIQLVSSFFWTGMSFKQVMPSRRQRLFAQLLSFTPTSGHPGVLLALHKHRAGCHLSFGLHERNPNVQVGEVRRQVLPSAHSLHCTYCGEERHFPDASARRQAVFGGVTKASVWYLQVIFQQSGSTGDPAGTQQEGNVLGLKRAS